MSHRKWNNEPSHLAHLASPPGIGISSKLPTYVTHLQLLNECRVRRPPEDALRLEAVRATEEVDALEHDGRNAVVTLGLESTNERDRVEWSGTSTTVLLTKDWLKGEDYVA